MKGSDAGRVAVFCPRRGRRKEKSGVVVVTSVVVGRRRVSSSGSDKSDYLKSMCRTCGAASWQQRGMIRDPWNAAG